MITMHPAKKETASQSRSVNREHTVPDKDTLVCMETSRINKDSKEERLGSNDSISEKIGVCHCAAWLIE